MKMLSPWIELSSGHAVRVLEGSQPQACANAIVQVHNSIPSLRVRSDDAVFPDWLNWAEGPSCSNARAWCDSMAKAMGYALPEEGCYVIQYADGAFNLGAEGTDMNGFLANVAEASRYTSMAAAREKLDGLAFDARIVHVRDVLVSATTPGEPA